MWGWRWLVSAGRCGSLCCRLCCSPSAEGKQLGLLSLLGASLKRVVGEIGGYSSTPSCPCASPELGLGLPALKEGGGLIFLHCCGAGSAVCCAIPREHAAASLRCAGALSSLGSSLKGGTHCGRLWHWPLPQLDHNKIICCARILGLLPERLIPLYFLHLLLTEAAFLTKFTDISQLPCCFILSLI